MRSILLAAAALATAALATPAAAGCYGTSDGRVCWSGTATGGTLYETCLYLGGPCRPVVVPGPTGCVTAGGDHWALSEGVCFG